MISAREKIENSLSNLGLILGEDYVIQGLLPGNSKRSEIVGIETINGLWYTYAALKNKKARYHVHLTLEAAIEDLAQRAPSKNS